MWGPLPEELTAGFFLTHFQLSLSVGLEWVARGHGLRLKGTRGKLAPRIACSPFKLIQTKQQEAGLCPWSSEFSRHGYQNLRKPQKYPNATIMQWTAQNGPLPNSSARHRQRKPPTEPRARHSARCSANIVRKSRARTEPPLTPHKTVTFFGSGPQSTQHNGHATDMMCVRTYRPLQIKKHAKAYQNKTDLLSTTLSCSLSLSLSLSRSLALLLSRPLALTRPVGRMCAYLSLQQFGCCDSVRYEVILEAECSTQEGLPSYQSHSPVHISKIGRQTQAESCRGKLTDSVCVARSERLQLRQSQWAQILNVLPPAQ